MSFEQVLAELRKRYPQQSFESNMDYAVQMQRHLDRNQLWTADDATPEELELKQLKELLDQYLT